VTQRGTTADSLGPLIPRSFYQADAIDVAKGLLGMVLRRGRVAVRITEVEAYRVGDSACHARFGRTARNAAMWGPGGHAYVYLCYGLHQMLNVVSNPDGEPGAVLIRSCEPIAGLGTIRKRRNGMSGPELLAGPGKVGAALALDPSWSGHALFEGGGLELREGPRPKRVVIGPRVGVDYAEPVDRAAPWRFAIGESESVTYRGQLR
jgi:DNA-3-methyladenine glycosylase